MKSVKKTASGAVSGVTDTVAEYKGWLILGLFAYLLWKFNGLFTGVTSSLTSQIDAATAEGKANAEAKVQAAKSQSDVTIKKAKLAGVAPGATNEQVIGYYNDAASIAAALGTTHGVYTMQWMLPDAQTAFTIIKNKYSRLLLSANKPYDKNTLKGQTHETPTSAKRKVNYTVLAPAYEEITGGRNLLADMKNWCSASKFQPVLGWIL